jgi:exodeoxyribonuclease III
LAELLQTEKPRVLGLIEHKLQECHVADVKTKLQSVAPDYEAHFTCSTAKKGYSGVALLCHTSAPPERVTFGLPGGAASEVALAEGRVATAEYRDAIVVVLYSPNSGQALERLQYRVDTWDPALLAHVQGLASSGKPVLVLGDFNAAHLDLDIWNVEAKHVPKSAGTTPDERASFGKFLDAGLVDTLRVQHPDAKAVFSYWSVRAKGRPVNRGLRLDYCLCSEAAASKLVDAFVLPAFAPDGDHAPVGAAFAF